MRLNLRHYLILLCSFLYIQVAAQTNIVISFNESDFQVDNRDGASYITTKLQGFSLSGGPNAPAFPYFPCRVLIPNEAQNINYSVEFKKIKTYKGIRMLGNPSFSRTSGKRRTIATQSIDSPVKDIGIVDKGEKKYYYLKITPFMFDSTTEELYFLSNITLCFPDLPDESHNLSYGNGEIQFVNDTQNECVNMKDFSIDKFDPIMQYPSLHELGSLTEYLIITNSTLAGSFNNLVNWKKNKAINSKIITTDSISVLYPGYGALADKIKMCIYEYYLNHGTKWVLLGGDESVVPVKYCFINYGDNLAPADIYYACFNGNFLWDANQNTLPAELSDSVDFNAQVYVTRFPVNTPQQVLDLSQKIMDYESGNINTNRLLLAGFSFGEQDYNETKSDAQQLTEMVYDQYIRPYWSNHTYSLFDKSSNLPDNDTYLMTGQNLYSEIEKGYNFILENSHGNVKHYSVDNLETLFYKREHAFLQSNYPGSIIVTGACLTNRFDGDTLCLSESLLRNPNGGAVAYFGSSRWGFGTQNSSVEERSVQLSDLYNGYFFKNLFSAIPTNTFRAFGAVSTQTKKDMLEECLDYTFERELQLTINPMGEPEMQIFTENPKYFGIDCSLPLIYNDFLGNKLLQIPADSCKVSFLSSEGSKYERFFSYSQTISLPSQSGILAIQKDNFVPFSAIISPTGNNLPFTLKLSQQNDNVIIMVSVKDSLGNNLQSIPLEKKSCVVAVNNAITGQQMVNESINSSQRCVISTAGWSSGLYVVKTTIDGMSLSNKFYIK